MSGRARFLVLLWGAALGLGGPAQAGDPPAAPILRIETGMHGAAINAIVADEADKQFLTVSDDKTLRFWSSADGSFETAARGPIGDGPEGELYALALSPSGKTVAVGGYTGIAWDGSAAIYLFNRKEASWIGRINVRSDAITHLAFSPDGHYLAVAANDAKGLRIIDTVGLSLKIADDQYKDAIQWLAFAPDGRLVTAALDGAVRLYDPSFRRIAEYRLPAGKPYSAAFSPDGGTVAVGVLDSDTVRLLSGRDLKPERELKGGEGRRGGLSVVAWAADGKSLYAAGTYGDAAGRKQIRHWTLAAPTRGSDVAVSADTINGLAALKDGRLAFASADPAWGVLTPDGQIAFRHDHLQADLRDGQKIFAVSNDGAVVDFGFQQGGKELARFDLVKGTLTLDPPPRADLKPPLEAAGANRFTDWRNGEKPKLDGKPLALDPNERSRSVAAASDWALLGTDFFLRGYRSGAPAWKTAVPAPVWTVNLSGDGRFAIAGLGDGTIRWYRLSDGALLLSLFAEHDADHWVLWLPEGFFDHGPGGEALIGYHLNEIKNGRPAGGAFVKVEQLYGLFFRRDLVVRRFLGDGEPEIAAQLKKIGDVRSVLGKGLPPALTLTEYCIAGACKPLGAEEQLRGMAGKLTPIAVGAAAVTLHFEIKNRGGGFGPVVLRNKGAAIAASGKTLGEKGDTRLEERTLPLQPGLNIISLSAFNAAKEIETDAKERPGLVLTYQEQKEAKPVLRLLAIGIDKFTSKDIPQLANAAADAKGVADIMRGDTRQDIFSSVDAIVLTDQEATLAAIDKAFDALAGRTRSDDLAMVFLAGHGVGLDGKYYYIPTDLPDTNPSSIEKYGLTSDDLAARMAKFPTTRAIVMLDTCYSGAFAVDDSILRDSRDQTLGKQISHATGRFILAGSSSQQEALDGVNGHGVFTQVLLQGLAGAADHQNAGNNDGKVSIYELGEFTKAQVPVLAQKIAAGHQQQPHWYFTGDDMFNLRDDN